MLNKQEVISLPNKANDDSSLSHTRWNCKYHIVFIPKYRRKVIYGKLRADIGQILRQLCEYKNVEIVEAHAMKDHIHMLVKIPPKLAVSSFMGYLKGKSSLMIFEKHANLKYKYGNRNFWAKGYYVSTVGLNTKVVEEYIRNQEKEDMIQDNLNRKEYVDPFKGVSHSAEHGWRSFNETLEGRSAVKALIGEPKNRTLYVRIGYF